MKKKRYLWKNGNLANSAKYDVSCSSIGVEQTTKGELGATHNSGICHTFTADGRCVSLLKGIINKHLYLWLCLLYKIVCQMTYQELYLLKRISRYYNQFLQKKPYRRSF